MSDWWFTRPIRPPDRTEQEKIQVPPIEEEKRIKEKFEKERQEEEKSPAYFLYATILRMVRQVADYFFAKGDLGEGKLDVSSRLLHLLIELKKILHLMEDQDLSQNSDVIQNLSDTWSSFKEVQEILQTQSLDTAILEKVQIFIQSFDQYPPDSEHSLGFYLTHHAGRDWLPFPFMDILKQIHIEFLEKEAESHLVKWTLQLDEMIQFFLPKT